jgi:very-short-patch-repair endonuclease
MRRQLINGALATRQHGIVARSQLLVDGWSRSQIDREVRTGRLLAVQRGVYAVGHRPSTDEARWMAAVLACGPGAVLSHRSAGALWGLPIGDNGLSHVTAPTAHTRRRVDVHRASLDPRDRTVRHGIPVTTLARTLADLAHSLDDASYHRAVKEAQFRKLFDDARIRDALTRRPTARLKRYLGDTTLTQSALEDAFIRLCRKHCIPEPQTQYGTKPRVDFIWHDRRLIVEVDGYEAHGTRAAFQDDRTTTNALLLAGYLVLRFTYDDVEHRPDHVAAQVLPAVHPLTTEH